MNDTFEKKRDTDDTFKCHTNLFVERFSMVKTLIF